jgi:TonB family protein
MKREILFVLLVLIPAFAVAQGEKIAEKWNVRYVKEHLLYQRGDEVNVIDADLEWPETVDFSAVTGLKKYLSKSLFAENDSAFDSAYGRFKRRFGEPVTKQFEKIPDDSKFCYADCELKILGYSHGRYISFSFSSVCSPASASTQKGDTIGQIFTYDMIRDKVMTLTDLLRTDKIENDTYPASFIGQLMTNVNIAVPDDVYAFNLLNAALLENSVLIRGLFLTNGGATPFYSTIKLTDMDGLLTKKVKTLLKQAIPMRLPHPVASVNQWKGDTVYTTVDKMPEYPGGRQAMLQYLFTNVVYPKTDAEVGRKGNVVVSFIIDKDGFVRDVRIVDPVSPEIDRETVRLITLMPKWIPGSLAGQAVNVRLTVPLRFELQQ